MSTSSENDESLPTSLGEIASNFVLSNARVIELELIHRFLIPTLVQKVPWVKVGNMSKFHV